MRKQHGVARFDDGGWIDDYLRNLDSGFVDSWADSFDPGAALSGIDFGSAFDLGSFDDLAAVDALRNIDFGSAFDLGSFEDIAAADALRNFDLGSIRGLGNLADAVDLRSFSPARDSQLANELIEQLAPGFERFGGDALAGYLSEGATPSQVTVDGQTYGAEPAAKTRSLGGGATKAEMLEDLNRFADIGGGTTDFGSAGYDLGSTEDIAAADALRDFGSAGYDLGSTEDIAAADALNLDPHRNFNELMARQGFVTFDTPEGFVTYRPDGTVETGTDAGRRSFYSTGEGGASFVDYTDINDPGALIRTTNEAGRDVYYHTDPKNRSYVVDYSDINDPNAMVQTASNKGDRNYYFDGNYVGYDNKGGVTTAGPSGSGAAKTVYNPDGSVTETKSDGSTVTTYKDGSKTTTDSSGDKTRTAAPDNKGNLLSNLLPLLLLMMAMRERGGTSAPQTVIPALTATQRQTPYTQIQQAPGYRPGQGGITYFEPVQYAPRMAAGGLAEGGIAQLARGRLLKGPGDGVSDSIPAVIGTDQPARLARGEYVIDARTVAELGNGSTDAGAERLDEMRRRVHAKRKNAKVGQDSKAYKALPA